MQIRVLFNRHQQLLGKAQFLGPQELKQGLAWREVQCRPPCQRSQQSAHPGHRSTLPVDTQHLQQMLRYLAWGLKPGSGDRYIHHRSSQEGWRWKPSCRFQTGCRHHRQRWSGCRCRWLYPWTTYQWWPCKHLHPQAGGRQWLSRFKFVRQDWHQPGDGQQEQLKRNSRSSITIMKKSTCSSFAFITGNSIGAGSRGTANSSKENKELHLGVLQTVIFNSISPFIYYNILQSICVCIECISPLKRDVKLYFEVALPVDIVFTFVGIV